MTVPNVTISWCQRKAECSWCEKTIEAGTPIVKVFFWNKGEEGNRRWNRTIYFHFPDCYVKQAKEYLEKNPYVAKHNGRPRIDLSPEDSRKRFLLIRQFNYLYQRRNGMDLTFPDNLLLDTQITEKMVEVMMEVAALGGVPKSWANKLG